MQEENLQKTTKTASKKTKKLTLINVIAAMFTSIFLIDSIVPAASTGSSTVIWYLIIGVAFYIPYGFITAEFSSKIPDDGGVYAWVKKTLGIGSAKRVSWYYWVNVGIWAPSISIYIAQLISYMWIPGLQDHGSAYNWTIMGMAIIFMWASLGFSYFPIVDNVKLYTFSTIAKVIIVIFLFLGAITHLASGNSTNTDFSQIPSEFKKTGALIMFLPALVYNILGLETIAGEASNIKNPKKILAKATIITTLSLFVFYILTTLAIQTLFNTANGLDLTGIIDGLFTAFGSNGMGQSLVNILGMLFIFTMFVETMGWVSGANAGVLMSAENKELPSIFKKTNRFGMNFNSTIILGTIGTLELVAFTLIGEIIDPGVAGGGTLFWSLFAASSNILFLSYFFMFVAYVKAKWTGQLDKYEGFSNNKVLGILMSIVAMIVLAITWFLLLWSPDYDVLQQTVPIIVSVLMAMSLGEVCFIWANKKYRKTNLKVESE